MKTVKPMQLSVLHRCFEHQGRKLFGVSVLAFLTLEEEPALLLETKLWPFLTEALGKDAAIEAGIPKAVSEYLVFGAAHAPDRRTTSGIAVRARFGDSEKTLHVFGDRYWAGGLPTSPIPFSSMPLEWSRAYGGADFPDNPLGKGHAPVEVNGRKLHPLPNIEYQRREVLSPDQKGVPAGFGAIDITRPGRASLVGTHDDIWLKTRFPGFADDIDWRHFNIASPDQWLNRPIAPDERYEFSNLHPARVNISGRLPGIVCRAFLNRRVGEALALEELPLTPRTAVFFPDRERLLLISQGMTWIADEQAADIAHLLIGADAVSNQRSIDDYRAVLEKRLDKEKGAFHALKDSDLTPRDMRLESLGKSEAGDDPSLRRALARAAGEIEKSRAMVAGYGLDPDKHAPTIPSGNRESIPPLEELPDFLEKQREETERLIAEQEEWAHREDDSLAAIVNGAGHDFGLILEERGRGQVGPPRFSAQAELDDLHGLSEKMKSLGQPVAELDVYLSDPGYAERMFYGERQMMAAYRLTAHKQEPAPRRDASDSATLKACLEEERRSGADFSGRDLTGADLSGIDLRGADLSGALLENSNLSGARLEGCNLAGAVLARSDLSNAFLDGACLAGANLGGANLTLASLRESDFSGAILVGADLTATVFTGSCLTEADLSGARFDRTDFTRVVASDMLFNEVDMRCVIFRSVTMRKSVFIKCNLTGADFSGADLSGSAFVGVMAPMARFGGACLSRCCFTGPCELAFADFSRADLSSANLRDTSLREARFESATLRGADFSGADLESAFFYKADARDARLVKSNLKQAVLASCNLMNGVLERAELRGADLRYANLFQADLARVRADSTTRLDGIIGTRARVYPRHIAGGGNDAGEEES